MPIQWTAELALGVPELDGQHLQIDAHLRMLHDPICEGRVPELADVLAGLRAVSSRHFESEEAFMRRHAYPALTGHSAAHRQFGERLDAFERAARRDGATMPLAMEVANWLAAWVREHQRHDGELRRYVDEARIGGG